MSNLKGLKALFGERITHDLPVEVDGKKEKIILSAYYLTVNEVEELQGLNDTQFENDKKRQDAFIEFLFKHAIHDDGTTLEEAKKHLSFKTLHNLINAVMTDNGVKNDEKEGEAKNA